MHDPSTSTSATPGGETWSIDTDQRYAGMTAQALRLLISLGEKRVPCHSEQREESRRSTFCMHLRFLVALGMTVNK
jgi:hypothetical protein